MLSGQVGKYRYYELKDISNNIGCTLCNTHTTWSAALFEEDAEQKQAELCIRCPIFMVLKLNKMYAEKLDEYERKQNEQIDG